MQSQNFGNEAKVGVWHFLITILSLSCYLNSLPNGFVHDDVYAIVNNNDVRPETPISNLLVNDFWGRNLQDARSHKSFRPLCTLTFRLNYLIHGLEPFGYHVVNILLHIAVVNVFCYVLLKIIFFDILPSGLVAMLFATHPIHVEAVTGVVGRGDVLSCLLFLLAFLNYARHLQKSKHIPSLFSSNFLLCILLGTACLFVKEHSVTVFGVCVIYDVIKNREVFRSWLQHRYTKDKLDDDDDVFEDLVVARGKRIIKRIVLLVVWTLLLFNFRLQLMGHNLPSFLDEDNPASFSPYLMTRILTYLYLLVFNSLLLIAPIKLSYDWQVGSIPIVEYITDLRNLQTFFFILLVLSLLAMILFRVWEDISLEIPLIGLTFMMIPFLPASNLFFRVGFVVAERILYIPSMGFCILVGYGFLTVIRYSIHLKSKLALALCYLFYSCLLVFFSMKTISYNTVWFSRETLFRSGVETLPHNAKAHYNYANYLKDENFNADAIRHYRKAVALYPIHSSSHNNLGSLLTSDKEAEQHFLLALRHTPGHYKAMLNLGSLYRRTGRFEEAENMLMKCLSLSPNYFDAQNLLAEVLQHNRKYEEAHALYKRMLTDKKSNVDVIMKYGNFLSDTGNFQESINMFESLISYHPKHYDALCSLAKAYGRNGNEAKSIAFYEKAITVQPSVLKAYHALAVHYINNNELQTASKVFGKSLLKCSPTSDHLRNHAAVLFQIGKRNEAVDILKKVLTSDPAHRISHASLISFMIHLNDKRTEEVISRALRFHPSDEEILLFSADWKRQNKQYDEARKIYHKVVLMNPVNFKAVHNLGIIYHMLDDLKNTEKFYKQAYELNPNDVTLQRNMKKLKRLLKKTT